MSGVNQLRSARQIQSCWGEIDTSDGGNETEYCNGYSHSFLKNVQFIPEEQIVEDGWKYEAYKRRSDRSNDSHDECEMWHKDADEDTDTQNSTSSTDQPEMVETTTATRQMHRFSIGTLQQHVTVASDGVEYEGQGEENADWHREVGNDENPWLITYVIRDWSQSFRSKS